MSEYEVIKNYSELVPYHTLFTKHFNISNIFTVNLNGKIPIFLLDKTMNAKLDVKAIYFSPWNINIKNELKINKFLSNKRRLLINYQIDRNHFELSLSQPKREIKVN